MSPLKCPAGSADIIGPDENENSAGNDYGITLDGTYVTCPVGHKISDDRSICTLCQAGVICLAGAQDDSLTIYRAYVNHL